MANAKDSLTQWTPLLTLSTANHHHEDPSSSQALSHAISTATTTATAMVSSTITSSSSSSSLDSCAGVGVADTVRKTSPMKKATPALTAKSFMQSLWDDDETKKPSSQQQSEHSPLGAATSSLAKFKAAQDLKIQTENLPESPKPKESNSTSSSTFTTPGTDTSSAAVTPKTPAPPSSTGKKRRRRTAAQIDRKFSCNYPGCAKAYGSEGSLTQHQRLKHRQPQPENGAAGPNNQSHSFIVPFALAARELLSSAHPDSAQQHFWLGRTHSSACESISDSQYSSRNDGRAAHGTAIAHGAATLSRVGSDELLGVHVDVDEVQAPESPLTLEFDAGVILKYVWRAAFMSLTYVVVFPCVAPVPGLTKQTSMSSTSGSTTRPQTTRKTRASCTPRAKAAPSSTTNRRGKCRSKSETLSEPMDTSGTSANSLFLAFSNEMKPPRSDRSVSDSFVSSHDSLIMPMSSTQSIASSGRHSYDWSSSIASDSPSSDQAIDSDILSVLADCDSSDVGESFESHGPPSTSSFRSSYAGSMDGDDQDMRMIANSSGSGGMDCFGISETASITLATEGGGGLRINDLFRRAEMVESSGASSHIRQSSSKRGGIDLGAFSPIKRENWADTSAAPVSSGGQSPNSVYLSTHMEKMSMIHGAATTPAHQQQHQTFKSDPSDPLEPLHIPLNDSHSRKSTSHNTAAAGGEVSLPGVMSSLDQFASVSVESFAVKQAPDLEPESMEICEPTVVKEESFVRMMEEDIDSATTSNSSPSWTLKSHSNSNNKNSMAAGHGSGVSMMKSDPHHQQQQQHMHWMKDFPTLSALEAQNQYVDELFQETMAAATMRGNNNNQHEHEWKAQKLTHGGSPRNFLRGLSAPSAHSTLYPNDKHMSAFNSTGSLGDFLFDVSEYGLEDTRMGSPLLCQQEEL